MIWSRSQKPTWSSPQETVRRTMPRASASARRPGSARGHEGSLRVLKVFGRICGLCRRGRMERGGQQGEGGEGEEPRDVEIEPVRQHELEADQQRGRERGELQLVLHSRHEVEEERAEQKQHLERRLHVVEVGKARVLVPVPDGERGGARQLPPERAVPEDAGGGQRGVLEKRDQESESRREHEATRVQELAPPAASPVGIGGPERKEQQRRELRPGGEADEEAPGRRRGEEHESPNQKG